MGLRGWKGARLLGKDMETPAENRNGNCTCGRALPDSRHGGERDEGDHDDDGSAGSAIFSGMQGGSQPLTAMQPNLY
jgi:hypothetical protein